MKIDTNTISVTVTGSLIRNRYYKIPRCGVYHTMLYTNIECVCDV